MITRWMLRLRIENQAKAVAEGVNGQRLRQRPILN
jgi:hypothetical protein